MRQQKGRALRGALAAMPKQRQQPQMLRGQARREFRQQQRQQLPPAQAGQNLGQVAQDAQMIQPPQQAPQAPQLGEVTQGAAQGIGAALGGYQKPRPGQYFGPASRSEGMPWMQKQRPQGPQGMQEQMRYPGGSATFNENPNDMARPAVMPNNYSNQDQQQFLQFLQQGQQGSQGNQMPMDKMFRFPGVQPQQAGQTLGAVTGQQQPTNMMYNPRFKAY